MLQVVARLAERSPSANPSNLGLFVDLLETERRFL
jgi:hypothetical protein